ncbi:MAG: sensor histidine kinase [Polaromonas sp.]|nr:sensor histidine kinase [Polaromonas sp.]
MVNRIRSKVSSVSPINFGACPAGHFFFGPRIIGKDLPMDGSIFQLKPVEKKLFERPLKNLAQLAWIHDERGAFAAAANSIREEEKTRVARELHDELAQPLTALKMDAIWVRDSIEQAPEAAAARLGEMVEMLDHAIAATRRIASDLRPLLLDDLGLVPAVEWLVSKFIQRSGMACTLAVDEALELPEPYATALFRIVQESLANVVKHAGASEVAVTIERSRDMVTLAVRDNGCGFSPAVPRKPLSLGLLGLRERAQLLKGKIVIESAPGKGTRIEVSFPLQQVGNTR